MKGSVIVSDSSWAASFAIDCSPFMKGFAGSDTMSQTLTPVTFGRYTTGIETPLQVPNECPRAEAAALWKVPRHYQVYTIGIGRSVAQGMAHFIYNCADFRRARGRRTRIRRERRIRGFWHRSAAHVLRQNVRVTAPAETEESRGMDSSRSSSSEVGKIGSTRERGWCPQMLPGESLHVHFHPHPGMDAALEQMFSL